MAGGTGIAAAKGIVDATGTAGTTGITRAAGFTRAAGLARGAISYLGRELVGPLIEALLPADCPACGNPLPGISRAGMCGACWSSIRAVVSPLCPRCGISRPTFPGEGGGLDHPCARCLDRPPAFDGARCALVFEGPVRVLLHFFKFDHRRDLARPLAMAMVDALPEAERFDLIVPVPLHWTRMVKRGYNQAALLAGRIGRAVSVPVAPRLLVKRRRTKDQAGLDAAARRTNVKGVFAVRKAVRRGRKGHWTRLAFRAGPSSPLIGLRILLVDDVLTTGSTVEECTRALKGAGASRVFVAAVARTPLMRSAVEGRD